MEDKVQKWLFKNQCLITRLADNIKGKSKQINPFPIFGNSTLFLEYTDSPNKVSSTIWAPIQRLLVYIPQMTECQQAIVFPFPCSHWVSKKEKFPCFDVKCYLFLEYILQNF